MLDELLERFGRGDRRALARLLSRAARGEADPLLDRLPPAARPARVVAVTGSAGVGKSTLVGKLIEHLRRQGRSVAVLACDPESPLSGGALLGDRFRMPTQPDDGVFIRSLAAAPGEGAIARHLGTMVRLLEAFGFEVVLIETAGAGQADTAVRQLADVFLLLVQPETGDDLQWEKAGVLEVADVIAIQKADLPGADQLEAQVRSMLSLSPQAAAVPVLRVSAKTGAGIGELWQALAAAPSRRPADSHGRQLLQLAQERLQHWFATSRAQDDPRLKELLHRWQQGQIPLREAAGALLRLAGNGLSEA